MQDKFPVAFYSRKLNSAQMNYTTMEKELLSIVESVEYFRNILLGFRTVIHSDHKNLSFETFKSERVRRWRLLLEEYDYSFVYTPGKDNIIADMLSRYPIHSVTSDEIKQMCTVLEVNSVEEQDNDSCPIDFRVIAKHQANDATLQTLLQTDDYSRLRLHNLDIIFYQKDKIAIPASLLDLIIKWYHTLLNHPGIDRTYRTISAQFYCKGMEARVRKLIRQYSCQKK